jgi:hypothetical protein
MTDKQYIVIVGTMFGSKTIHGPFGTYEAAENWAFLECDLQRYEIVPMESPLYTSKTWKGIK